MDKTPRKRASDSALKLYYQPIVQPMFNKTIGFEALIRLFDKEKSFVSPAVFIPIAEKSGLNDALGAWVMEETCRTIKKLNKKGIDFEYISLNVSTKHFRKKQFTEDLYNIVQNYSVKPANLCLEISEDALTAKSANIVNKMNLLRSEGYRIALDDFAGKLSTLEEMDEIPVDFLKLDKKYVDKLMIDDDTKTATRDIIEFAVERDIEVIAKGIEDVKQQKELMAMGCNKMQGFLFGVPLKETEILRPKDDA